MTDRSFFSLLLYTTMTVSAISAQESQQLINPFRIDIDPMERLLLVNFENDPDTLYIGFEPQVFNDAVNGRGHLVIGWRADGKVDVYHERGLTLNPAKYDIAGKGLRHMLERTMQAASFEVTDSGVQVQYAFKDIHNREVFIMISENHPKRRKPFGLLAPMGDAVEDPSSMPLVMLHDFYFVRKRHTDFSLSIDGRQHQPDALPMPMDGSKMHFTRYSPRPLIATFNPSVDGPLAELPVNTGQLLISSENHDIHLEWISNRPLIKKITRHNDIWPVELRFKPSFPDISGMSENASLKGTFEIEGHRSVGRIRGHYVVEKTKKGVTIVMVPSGGWKPRPTKLSLRFLYRVGKVFRKWPATYEWSASITESDAEGYRMTSSWRRIADH